VLISRNGFSLTEIQAGGVIGTSSLRRAAQLRHLRPDLEVFPLRGNVETRIRKLDTDPLAAVVLAAAGVKRLGLEHRITEHLDADRMLPAVGQGALCLEIRAEDPRIGPMISTLDHPATRTAVSGERAFLRRLEGGCQVPIAGYGRMEGLQFTLTGLVAAVDGSRLIKHSLSGRRLSERIGVELAEIILSRERVKF
jgi:hydroxymethylbilane synthase